ncbi:MAG: pyruvate kinase [Thermodesulfobacteriota bacterium]
MTKIVCTIGPASESEESLKKLIKAGMNVARLNFSHGTHSEHKKVITRIRAISKELGIPVSILQDLAGPKIRIGEIEKGSINLESGKEFILTSRKVAGNENEVSTNYQDLPKQAKTGDTILLSDGSIELIVTKVLESDVRTKVLIGGELTSKKGLNIPARSLNISTFTTKDKKDLDFGIKNGIDIVALSFVKNVEDILKVKRFMKRRKSEIPIIAKIETHEALVEIDSIMEAVEGIMVARGDLGVEIPLEKVPIVQKKLISKANYNGKTVITATQMLRSMVENARPTRAEAADITNAILDGTDAVMLSEETAVGKYPSRSVEIMGKISKRTIESDLFDELIWDLRNSPPDSDSESLCLAACNFADNIDAVAIVAYTESGSTARHISKNRPRQKIIAITPRVSTYHYLNLVWGVTPFLIERKYFDQRNIERLIKSKIESEVLRKSEKFIVVDETSMKVHEAKI